MIAWPQRLTSELEAADRHATDLASALTFEQLNWRPGGGVWSVGQCLRHLYLANKVYLPAMTLSLKGRQRRPVEQITPGWFGRWFIRTYIEPSTRSSRAKAPRKIAPSETIEPSVLQAFLQSNRDAQELVRRASDYDVNRIRFRNPFVPLLRFTVGTGLEIISKHESRHLQQAERIRRAPGFPER